MNIMSHMRAGIERLWGRQLRPEACIAVDLTSTPLVRTAPFVTMTDAILNLDPFQNDPVLHPPIH